MDNLRFQIERYRPDRQALGRKLISQVEIHENDQAALYFHYIILNCFQQLT